MRLLVRDISELATGATRDSSSVFHRHALLIDSTGRVEAFGPQKELLDRIKDKPYRSLSAGHRLVTPGFVDSHTHLLFAGSRAEEYEAKVAGESYEKQHKSGGIASTVRATREASDKELLDRARLYLKKALSHGTTTIEIKTGYGLNQCEEMRLLRLLSDLKDEFKGSMTLVRTFLGAHCLPSEYAGRSSEYLAMLQAMLPDLVGLAEFVDAWCDPLGFSSVELRPFLNAAKAKGFGLKIHADQTGACGAAELAAELGAASAEHLDFVSDAALSALALSGTSAVLLPGVSFHLMDFGKNIDINRFKKAGVSYALATNFNPGSSPCFSMQTMMEFACRFFRLSSADALSSATLEGARALRLEKSLGQLTSGFEADFIVHRVSTLSQLTEEFGANKVRLVYKKGREVVNREGLQ